MKRVSHERASDDIQYRLYIAEKLKNARQQIAADKISSQDEVEKRLEKWIIKSEIDTAKWLKKR